MNDRDPSQESQPEQEKESTGFLVGLGLLLVSGYFFVTSFFIPHPEGWQTAPGMLPMFLGGTLFVMAAIITLDTVRKGAIKNLFGGGEDKKAKRQESDNSLRRAFMAIAGVAVFYFVLLEFMPFEIAAFLFLAGMTQLFWDASSLAQRLIISILVPFLLTGAFQGIFGIPLPGDSNLVQEFMYWMKG
ncbi:MAG: tripartite tricarboxylate transporter TctB family protein [Rhodospirillales bacterium]